jgi:hypothetical protein
VLEYLKSVFLTCQISVDQDAPNSATVSKKIPTAIVICVPYLRTHIVATGETTWHMEIERPPTKAYSKGVAPGNVFVAR